MRLADLPLLIFRQRIILDSITGIRKRLICDL
jgi:hypothetical protein